MEICWDARPRATTGADENHIPSPSTTITLDNVQEHLFYLTKYRVLICREHATGVQNIDVHLRDQHAVPSKERKAIIAYCRRWQIAMPQDVELPPPLEPPIEELGTPLDAYHCQITTDCSFCTVSMNRMQKHCNKDHKSAWKKTHNTWKLRPRRSSEQAGDSDTLS
jgi:hypothetical protein